MKADFSDYRDDLESFARNMLNLYGVDNATSISLAPGEAVDIKPGDRDCVHMRLVSYERLESDGVDALHLLARRLGESGLRLIHKPLDSLSPFEADRRRMVATNAAAVSQLLNQARAS